MSRQITPEMIAALVTLRAFALCAPASGAGKAISILDSAGFFAPIDEACDELENERETSAQFCTDPAEWGDTTREAIARRHGLTASDVNWDAGRQH